jgi:hypothetical protein
MNLRIEYDVYTTDLRFVQFVIALKVFGIDENETLRI